MKRKLLIAATSFMIASSVCGKDFNVLTKDFQPWGNTQFDMEGMKITWTQKWQGGGWWLAQDCSEYESARIEFREVLPMDVVFIVIYSAKDERNEKLKSKVTIPAGKTTSEDISIRFLKLDELEIDATYLCPLSIGGSERVGVMDGSRTMYYLVRRSSAITTAMNLKNVYVTVPGFDKGSATADVVNNLSAVTMEAIIRVNTFDEGTEISSIMGIEMYLQMRLGDANFPRQQLQVQTTFGKFPEASKTKQLQAGEWYHVALTWDLATKTIAYYVNGQLQSISTNHGKSDLTSISLGDKVPDDEFGNGGDHNFYFGRSYTESHDLSRQFNGEICEARIWSIARTQEQICQNMYDIPNPTEEPTLCAYWKFDEGTGLEVEDRTGHGNNAKVVPYWKTVDHVEAYSKTDAELWPSGIEVPIMNK